MHYGRVNSICVKKTCSVPPPSCFWMLHAMELNVIILNIINLPNAAVDTAFSIQVKLNCGGFSWWT